MITNNIIAITGNMGAGKDTFGKLLIEEARKQGAWSERFAFADTLKELARAYFGWDGKKDAAGRRLLQGLGTFARRYVDENFWTQETIGAIRDRFCTIPVPTPKIIVITDLRYINEVKQLSKFCSNVVWLSGFKLIRIFRDGHTGDDHSSETEQHTHEFSKLVNYSVHNNATIEDLRPVAAEIITGLL